MNGERLSFFMIIVALQNSIDGKYAIWNTVTDEFLGVNLGKYEAVGMIMDYKKCSYADAIKRVVNLQHFSDILRQIE